MEFLPLRLRIVQGMCAIAFIIASLSQADVNAESKFQPLQNASNPQELKVKRSDFPIDFVFGVTTAAAQMEGSACWY
ncbi:hypothetical protein ACFX1X_039178 [Malus domestica]